MSEQRAGEILEEIRSSLLECHVCLEVFDSVRTPRALPCGHMLCVHCVCALSHPALQNLECPFCRRLWDVGCISECRVLVDLREILQAGVLRGKSPVGSGTLRLRSAFGGWGTILNPTGMAISELSGDIVVVHDGEKRVGVFDPQGTLLNSFGCHGHTAADVCHPLDVAVTGSGHVLLTDAGDRSLKVFTPAGRPLVVIRDVLRLPWGVDVDARGRVLVSDAQMGTLSQIVIDFTRGVVLANRVVVRNLTSPRSVASCKASGNVAVVEHFPRSFSLRVFDSVFVLLNQVDGFGLSLRGVCLSVSAVGFDGNGDVMVGDAGNGTVWRLGNPRERPDPTPLVCGLVRPVGLAAALRDELVVLDAGDHAVKHYTRDL